MKALDASLDAIANLPAVPGVPSIGAALPSLGMPPVASSGGQRSASGGEGPMPAGTASTGSSAGRPSPAPERAAAPAHEGTAVRAGGSKKPVASAAAYHAATLGMTVVRHASIEVTDAGVFAAEVPEVWRVRAGSRQLPLVAVCFSMLEAILLVEPKLDKKQLQSLSVWSDGFLT